jgi:methionine aminopeptidase
MSEGYGIATEFCGHGIGEQMHMPPPILHIPNDNAEPMQVGM